MTTRSGDGFGDRVEVAPDEFDRLVGYVGGCTPGGSLDHELGRARDGLDVERVPPFCRPARAVADLVLHGHGAGVGWVDVAVPDEIVISLRAGFEDGTVGSAPRARSNCTRSCLRPGSDAVPTRRSGRRPAVGARPRPRARSRGQATRIVAESATFTPPVETRPAVFSELAAALSLREKSVARSHLGYGVVLYEPTGTRSVAP